MAFHTGFTKGKRVIVFLKKGKPIVGKFDQSDFKKKVVILRLEDDPSDEPTKIPFKRIREIGYYRQPTSSTSHF